LKHLSVEGPVEKKSTVHNPPYFRLSYRIEPLVSCERRCRDHEHWQNLRPDALADYQAGEQRVRFWLELDRATMVTLDLVAKFKIYTHYVTSREWFRKKAELLLLLMVAPGREQKRGSHA
jgi:hypothetical protein